MEIFENALVILSSEKIRRGKEKWESMWRGVSPQQVLVYDSTCMEHKRAE
jgi:hypothetical protein